MVKLNTYTACKNDPIVWNKLIPSTYLGMENKNPYKFYHIFSEGAEFSVSKGLALCRLDEAVLYIKRKNVAGHMIINANAWGKSGNDAKSLKTFLKDVC